MSLAARFFITRSNLPWATGTIACCVQLALTIPLAYVLNVWQDDAYTLHSTGGSIAYAFHEAIGFEQNAPLYFVVIDLWRHINEGAFFARFFSVLCAALATLLTPALADRYLPSIDRRLVTFGVALNPFLIWAALEIRLYALVVLLSALLLVLFYDGFLRTQPLRSARWLYATVVCVALYTQYYLAFLVAAQAIVLAVVRRASLSRFILACFLGALAFAPMLVILPSQVQNFRGGFIRPTLVLSTKLLTGILVRYVLPLSFAGHRRIVYALIALCIFAVLIAIRKHFTGRGYARIVALGSLGAALLIAATTAEGVLILTRHAAFLFLSAVFTPFAALTFLAERERLRAAAVWTAVLALAYAGTLFVTYRAGAKAGDWKRVTAYVMRNEKPGEPILVFQAENALPFSYYYHGRNRVVPLPKGVNFSVYNVEDFVVHNAAQIAAAIPPNAHQVWLITAGGCASANIGFGCDVVHSYFARRYRQIRAADFYQSHVRLLEKRSN